MARWSTWFRKVPFLLLKNLEVFFWGTRALCRDSRKRRLFMFDTEWKGQLDRDSFNLDKVSFWFEEWISLALLSCSASSTFFCARFLFIFENLSLIAYELNRYTFVCEKKLFLKCFLKVTFSFLWCFGGVAISALFFQLERAVIVSNLLMQLSLSLAILVSRGNFLWTTTAPHITTVWNVGCFLFVCLFAL